MSAGSGMMVRSVARVTSGAAWRGMMYVDCSSVSHVGVVIRSEGYGSHVVGTSLD